MQDIRTPEGNVVGGEETHKDLHVASIVDGRDQVLGTQSFFTTRQGYRQMVHWMQSFGVIARIGECQASCRL